MRIQIFINVKQALPGIWWKTGKNAIIGTWKTQ
jgi:hypothetical protein